MNAEYIIRNLEFDYNIEKIIKTLRFNICMAILTQYKHILWKNSENVFSEVSICKWWSSFQWFVHYIVLLNLTFFDREGQFMTMNGQKWP